MILNFPDIGADRYCYKGTWHQKQDVSETHPSLESPVDFLSNQFSNQSEGGVEAYTDDAQPCKAWLKEFYCLKGRNPVGPLPLGRVYIPGTGADAWWNADEASELYKHAIQNLHSVFGYTFHELEGHVTTGKCQANEPIFAQFEHPVSGYKVVHKGQERPHSKSVSCDQIN